MLTMGMTMNELADDLAAGHCAEVVRMGVTEPTADDADDFERVTLAERLRDVGLPGTDDQVAELRAQVAGAIREWVRERDESMLDRATAYLDADERDDGYAYRDDATRRWYLASRRDLIDLGYRLARKQIDAYSLWCSDTESTELRDPTDD
jgi:hypothetical protein